MEERKTAAIVLSIVALIFIYLIVIRPYIDLKRAHTVSFKNCSVSFYYRYNVDTIEDAYSSAQDSLALCLCKAYDKKADSVIGKQIMKIYLKYGNIDNLDTINHSRYHTLDTILKHRNITFNTKISCPDCPTVPD
jgi:hypothetical protein